MATRVFVEGTCTYVHRHVGGIHRVVRRVVDEMVSLPAEFDVECVPTVFRRGRLRDARSLVSKAMSAGVSARLWDACASTATWLTGRDAIEWRSGDLLLMIDASWGKRIWPAVWRAKEHGATVGVVIHDLIPIHYPEFFDPALPPMFRSWLAHAADHADFFIADSRATRDDLHRYLRQNKPDYERCTDRLDSFRLGSDPLPAHSLALVRDEVRDFLGGGEQPYLIVCTIEPRKNHAYLLDAFEAVWQSRPEARLCIVGKIGWRCDHIVSRIREYPQFGRQLMMFNDLSDAEVRFCYQNSKAFVFPSIIEGFGLPIVEALHYGLPVLASDTAIHREVGGDYCQYFDLRSAESLASMLRHGEPTAVKQPYRSTTWNASCQELLTKALHMAASAMARRDSSRAALVKPAA